MNKPVTINLAYNPYIKEDSTISDDLYELIVASNVTVTKNTDIKNVIQILKDAGWLNAKTAAHDELKNNLDHVQAKRIVDICLNKLGLNQFLQPTANNYDLILILGAILPDVSTRFDYYLNIVQQNENLKKLPIYILTGTRSTHKSLSENAQEFEKIAKGNDLTYLPQNELEVIHFLLMNKFSNIKEYTIINDDVSSDVKQTHATTASTMHKFLDGYLKLDNIDNILVVSNQPYIAYQQAVLTKVINDRNYNFAVETVGYESKYDIDIKFQALELLDTVVKTIDNIYKTTFMTHK